MFFKCIHNNLRAIRIAIISMRMTTTEHFFDADDTNLDDYCWNCVARFMFMLPFTKNIYIVYQYHPDCNTCCAVAARLHFGKMHIACCFMRTHMPLNSKLSNFSIFNTLKQAELEIIHWNTSSRNNEIQNIFRGFDKILLFHRFQEDFLQ